MSSFTSGTSLLASLRADRFLLVATIVCSVAVLLPLFLTPFVPLQDLPNHVALASLLSHLSGGGEVSSHHFMNQPYPVPYWVGYMLIFIGAKVASPLFGAKLFVAVALLVVPLGMMRLLPSLGRSPRLGLWAFALSWDHNLSWGFVAFNLATGLSLVYVAWAIDSLSAPRWRWSHLARAVGLGALIAITHAHATVVVAISLGALALSELPKRDRALRLLQFSVAPFVGLLPWLVMGFASRPEASAMPENLSGLGHSPNAAQRVGNLFNYTLDFVHGNLPESLMAICFVVLLVIPLLLLAPSRPRGDDWRRALMLYVIAWVLYLTLPASLYWPFDQIFIQQRHASLILLMGLALPSCELTGRYAWRLAPGLIAVALSVGVNVWLSHSFGKRSEPFLEIIDAIPSESKVLPLLLETRVPESRRTLFNQFSAYVIALKGGYSPYLFDTPNLMVRYRPERHLPHPKWGDPGALSLEEHVPHYDYLLVQGKEKDPIPKKLKRKRPPQNIELTEIKEAGIWRLYQIQRQPD